MRTEATGTTPGDQGRFDGYDVLSQERHWDGVTAAVVLGRVRERGGEALRYFDEDEGRTAGALLDLLLGQHDEPRVPVLELVDERLAAGETDGWRYEDLPEDGEMWRRSLAYLDEDAAEAFGEPFARCDPDLRGRLVQGVQDADSWHGVPAKHVWSLWTRYACAAFYAHPWAWNEIGFGGPAYPRGYKVLHPGWLEPFERRERDAADPIPWARRVEAARRAHETRTSADR